MSTFKNYDGSVRPLLSDASRQATFDEIPIISLTASPTELIDAIRDACGRVGFFYIRDHGIPQSVIDAAFEQAAAFFAQPHDRKDEIHIKKSTAMRGWEPMPETWVDPTQKPDRKETFAWGYEPSIDPDASPEDRDRDIKLCSDDNAMAGKNLWPTSVPAFTPAITTYYGAVLQLARRLIRVFAVALNLSEDFFDGMFSPPGAFANLVHYPPQPPTDPSIGISPHTDYECLTILCQSSQAGLQVLNPRGEWIAAPPIPGTFVVNIGDMLQRWSNNLFVSTAHRVINITGEERYSIPLFLGPNYDTMIAPLPTCLSAERPALYEPVQAGKYVFDRLAEARYRSDEKARGQAVLLTA